MKTLVVSSSIVLGGICISIILWQLFGGSHRKEAQIEHPSDKLSSDVGGLDPIWLKLWTERDCEKNKTNLGWIFTIARRNYDPEFRHTLLHRKWKNGSAGTENGDKAAGRDFDGLREKRASSIVTYFCIFVLVLSLIRAALDMNSNLKKSREENVNQTINLDSRRCSLNDFKLAQAHLKKREQTQRRASLLRRAMTIVESPLAAAQQQQQQQLKSASQQSLNNNLSGKEGIAASKEKLEKQPSITSDTSSTTDSPTKLRPRFSSVSPTPPHLRRMSFPALRRGSSMDVVHADMDDLIAHHSPEVKRRMRLLRH